MNIIEIVLTELGKKSDWLYPNELTIIESLKAQISIKPLSKKQNEMLCRIISYVSYRQKINKHPKVD